MRKYTPGNVYGMEMSEDRKTVSIAVHPHKEFIYQYRNVDADMCAAIRIAHNAALDAERNYKKSKQMSSTETSLEALAPLREKWRASDRTNRRLMELSILAYLQS